MNPTDKITIELTAEQADSLQYAAMEAACQLRHDYLLAPQYCQKDVRKQWLCLAAASEKIGEALALAEQQNKPKDS